MFQGMNEGALLYVLDKGSKKDLRIGQVVRVSNPYMCNTSYPQKMVVDVIVNFDGVEDTIKRLPSMESISEDRHGVVFSDNQEAMKQHVTEWVNTSKKAIDTMPYHQEVVAVGEPIMRKLDPKLEAELKREEKIVMLESKMSGMEGTLTDIREMLNIMLSKKKNEV